ncbi:S-adenosyl-L-methionine-dependent tRNA 4-demethylwyosine synthase TYW1-like [Xenia sp. Carnegie-2017]|uniref:S-adenosyl-L-methionine-dependent tRNA 4-demethylwyosine synthase TYW1-like n=1 Tax=Xenia sp. Carnegie-2017 TaxID=2897299 RepID=UPI001F0378A6|nr:S-adenosyl-L-methionine-dependent tRNA 4-demethylwyosine synthase TYW1-like [Xenia sp. Carnegie-2017]
MTCMSNFVINRRELSDELKIITYFAEVLKDRLQQDLKLNTKLIDLRKYDPDESLRNEVKDTILCIFIMATYTDGQPTDGAEWFYKWLKETAVDFRVQKTLLSGLNYCVLGLGNSLYADHFNKVGKDVDKWLHDLSAIRFMALGTSDENVSKSENGGKEEDFRAWVQILMKKLKAPGFYSANKGNGLLKNKDEEISDYQNHNKSTNAKEQLYDSASDVEQDNENGYTDGAEVVDVEDLGNIVGKMNEKKKEGVSLVPKEMITPLLRKSLTKQGYKLVGSHSGVKLCRWTKSMLRGRGGCYKHTFYGIESHRCMESTPSLACANKCVFCWRHHTNPVGTEWRWKMDEPDDIVNEAIKKHCDMIKQFKGVPGVKAERLEEGMAVRHCALSLVGEPIMYPKINDLLTLLHGRGISSFLVTNAQFPDAIRNLLPVTQLYVSVDASTRESLKKIDRPLFRDFWSRFLESLRALADKGQRTVYRLTLVKGWNAEEIKGYTELVSLGRPDFIEVKGVTYCGDSKASSLTMKNVPWHEEVIGFVKQLTDALPDYEIACEHEHSNCLLIAKKKFKVDEKWHTWIDYSKFHSLMKRYQNTNGLASFTSLDYMEATPSWAVFGDVNRGFDPNEARFKRKGKMKDHASI